jgi:hypothetical protein
MEKLERWLADEFVAINTALELGSGSPSALLRGAAFVESPIGPNDRYRLLGSVGMLLGACARHGVDGPELAPVRSAASYLGTSLGVAPRFVFTHQVLYGYRTFTSLEDDHLFVTQNGIGVLAYRRAAEALRQIPAMGVASPVAGYLLETARSALGDVLRVNQTLHESLDVDMFFNHVRPYFAPYPVNGVDYRGANAGDLAAINEIDLLLGLCSATDPFYVQVVREKYPYMPPPDQRLLRAALSYPSLLAAVVREPRHGALFLEVCRVHAAASTYHFHKLVKPFVEEPFSDGAVTASGPPLPEVLAWLARLSDLRAARDRPGLVTARASLNRLRARISGG